MSLTAAALRAVLESLTPPAATGWVLALSGGRDSACLASALALAPTFAPSGRTASRHLPIRAIHVDHGLQEAAPRFRQACEALCDRLELPLTHVEVCVDISGGESIEAAARAARYAALAADLRSGECLLTAHHASDQAETLLLQLLRGSGLKGLSAMPSSRPFGAGWHLRPLLDVSRADLEQFAAAQGIAGVNDPMNQDERFDRVYLRRRVWPVLAGRWPGAAVALSRTAAHMAQAQALLDRSAAEAVRGLRDGPALSVNGLRALPPPEQANAVRFWITSQGVAPPPAARLREALRQCIEAEDDHLPMVAWAGHALRRYRRRLFLTPAQPPCIGDAQPPWELLSEGLELGPGKGRLICTSQRGGLDARRLSGGLSVRQRVGGETVKPSRRARTQSLQHLCQSLGVLPWMRDALPLLYCGDSLVAVADLWRDTRWCVAADAPGLAIEWRAGPIVV